MGVPIPEYPKIGRFYRRKQVRCLRPGKLNIQEDDKYQLCCVSQEGEIRCKAHVEWVHKDCIHFKTSFHTGMIKAWMKDYGRKWGLRYYV